MRKYSSFQKVLALVLTLVMVIGLLPSISMPTEAAAVSNDNTVADPGTAHGFETMMGTAEDGNRYAGRVWVDKSVYTDGDTVMLNTSGADGSTFEVSLAEGENFQVVFSALGSSTSINTTTSSTGPLDVVLILDNSSSMGQYTSYPTNRLEAVTAAANSLIADILSSDENRLAVVTYSTNATTLLPLDSYAQNDSVLSVAISRKPAADSGGGVAVSDGDGKMTASAVSLTSNSTVTNTNSGYQRGTNLQSGINMGMGILASASNTTGRTPVVIVMTDGVADMAVSQNWNAVTSSSTFQHPSSNNITSGVALSTLLNAAYMKASVEDNYGKAANVYGVGVDLGSDSAAKVVMDPATAFNANGTSVASTAYSWYQSWISSSTTVTQRQNNINWSFNQLPSGSTVTKEDVQANINYVDTYYDVTSAELEDTFDEIFSEISSGIFNPITSTGNGATGVDGTPLIYVDNIGQYMEVKDIQAVTLFGASYEVTKNDDGTYTVAAATGVNPTTGEAYSTQDHIQIRVTEDSATGLQSVQIHISQEILPILLDQIAVDQTGDETTTELYELTYNPLRIYYTVGVDSDILLPTGGVDITKIDPEYAYVDDATGEITFYSNYFGQLNTEDADNDNLVDKGDAHVGFVPSNENRYYYHQTNQGIFTDVSVVGGGEVTWEAGEYGLLWEEGKYELTWLTYEDYQNLADDAQVYTYVTFVRPVKGATDGSAEEVTYLVYTTWGDLKESVAFYDNTAKTYINYDAANGYVTGDVGYVIDEANVASTISAYQNAVSGEVIYGVLGMGSNRVSRLHNMTVDKTSNPTNSAELAYAPEYNSGAHSADDIHEGSEVIVWLGNNGALTVQVDTGIALTKQVSGNIEGVSTYEFAVQIPAGVTAAPVVKTADGTVIASTYTNHVLTFSLAAGETAYITGIPGGTVCQVSENIPADADYEVQSILVNGVAATTVTVPTASQIIGNASAVQYVPVTVTNIAKGYGDLTIVKDVQHSLTEVPEALANKTFTFKVQLPVSLAGETFNVDAANASSFTGTTVTVGDDGSITVTLKDNESITIIDLPEGTQYTVTETTVPDGYTNTTGTVEGTVARDGDHDAHFVNEYSTTPITPHITVTGTKTVDDASGIAYTGNEEFTFVLSQYVGVSDTNSTGYITLGTATAKDGEDYTFDLGALLSEPLDIGEYYFRVTEQAGTTAGMTYDATRGLFVVTVTDADADGTLEYTVTDYANTTVTENADGSFTVEKDFTNVYDVDSTYVDVNIVKTLEDNTGVNLPLNIFHFELVNDNDSTEVWTATTDATGKATIRIPYTSVGTYTYTLREVAGNLAGMNYDPDEYTVTVVVSEQTVTEGETTVTKLVATATIALKSAAAEDAQAAVADDAVVSAVVTAEFQNSYKLTETSLGLTGTKKLSGTTLTADAFTFALYETDSSFTLAADAEPIQTKGNAADGSITFDAITYQTVGNRYYVIKEVAGSNGGMTYDTVYYHVTVSVTVDGAALKATYVVNKIGTNSDESGDIVFVNSYTVDPTEYTIGGNKLLHGRAVAAGEFEFALYEGDTLLETVKNLADGTFTFDTITYDAAGEYVYTVKEVVGTISGVSYATNSYTVTVTVTDNGDGTLSASADVANADIQFENTYTADPAYVTLNGTKSLPNKTLEADQFTFALYETDHTFNTNGLTPVTTTNSASGAFSFGSIKYETTGIYFYVIVEDATNPVDNVVYDSTVYRFRVVVSDIGDGQLKAVVENLTAGTTINSDAEGMASASVSFTNIPYDDVVKKEVFRPADMTTNIDGEQVNVGETLTYTIEYTNHTGEDATVTITDTIPAYTTFVRASDDGVYANGVITWTLDVQANETVEVSVDVTVDAYNVIFTNAAIVRDGSHTYTTNEVVNHTVTDEVVKDVFSAEDTSVSIDGQEVEVGDVLFYTVTYTNATADAVTVTITDEIPAYTTYVADSADNGGVYENDVLTWSGLNVPAWQKVTVSFEVTVDEVDKFIENQANALVGTNTISTNVVTNHTVDEIVVKEVFEADQTTNIDGQKVEAGDVLEYAITYTNTTGADVTVTITDTIPEHTTYVEGSADNKGVYSNGTITWTLDVAENATVKVSFQVKVDGNAADVVITNEATVREGNNTYTTNEITNHTYDEIVQKDVFDSDDTTISIDGKQVTIEDSLVYTVRYTNTSDDTVVVTITDEIPAHTTYVDGTAGNGVYNAATKTITWSELEVAPWETVVVSFIVDVDDDAQKQTIRNQATVLEGQNTYTTNVVVNHTVEEVVEKDVALASAPVISIDGKQVNVGDELVYTIEYANITGQDASVTITDKIPAYTTFVSAEDGGQYNAETGVITWKLDVEAWDSVSVSFKVKVADAQAVIQNQATVLEGENEYKSNEVTNHTVEDIVEKDVFSVSDTATSIDGEQVEVDDVLLYTIEYINITGEDVKLTITDRIPEHTTYVADSADNDGAYANGVITWTLDVKAWESVTVSFEVTVDDADVTVENQATVNDGKNEYTTNEVVNHTVEDVTEKDVALSSAPAINIDGKKVNVGDELVYTIDYTNVTGQDASVTITDQIPAHTTFVSAEDGGQYNAETGEIIWTLDVEAWHSVSVSFKVKVVDAEAIIENQATVLEGANTYITNEVTTHTVEDVTEKDVALFSAPTVSIDGAYVEVGETLVYSIDYVNVTGQDATVTITDKVPAHTTYVDGSAGDGIYADGVITWTLDVRAWDTATVTFQVTVDDPDVFIENQATVLEGENTYTTNEVVNHTFEEITEKDVALVSAPSVSMDGKVVEIGDELVYTIEYTNTTGQTATVTITDTIPAHTTYVDGSAGDGVYADGKITWTLEVPAQETISVSFNVVVNGLNTTVTNQATVVEGENTYTTNPVTNTVPDSVSHVLEAKKEYNKPLNGGEFTFTLESADDQTSVKQEKTNGAGGKIIFDEVTFSNSGTYTFTVKEIKKILGFINYSTAEYEVTITVTNENGVLKVSDVSAVNTKNTGETNLTFVNTYVMDGEGEVTLRGTKTLTGDRTTVNVGEFEFGLYDSEGNLVESVKNDADGNFAFSTMKFDEDDVEVDGETKLTYTIKEIAGDNARYTYDDAEYPVVITIKDDDKGGITVSYTVDGKENGTASFTNTYTNPTPVTYQPVAEKKYNKPLNGGEFTFTLEGDGYAAQEKTNGVDGKVFFDTLSFPEADEYTFTIKEIKKVLGFISYSTAEYELTVKVIDTKGVLSISDVSIVNTKNTGETDLIFVNTYILDGEDSIVIDGSKQLTGDRALVAEEFTFGLYNAAGELVEKVTNGADGTFAFSALFFDEEDVDADITYTVKEILPVDGDGKEMTLAMGVTYDTTVYTVDVEVKDNEEGGVEASWSVVDAEKITFVNDYQDPEPVTVALNILKNVVNNTEPGIGLDGFQFQLVYDGEVVKTAESDENGTAGFTASFDVAHAGQTFEFEISEVKGSAVGVTYDTTVHTVEVEVVRNADGSLKTLVNGKEAAEVTVEFTNTYSEPSTPVTGDNFSLILIVVLLGVSAAGIVVVLLMKKPKKGGKYAR